VSDKQKQDRYEMHKYWGKKPSSSLSLLINKYSKKSDALLDPFAGYGVFPCEAYLMGRNIIANDLNPIAKFLNEQLLNENIDLGLLQEQWSKIKNDFQPYVDEWYGWTVKDQKAQLVSVLRDNSNNPIKAKVRVNGDKRAVEVVFSKQEIRAYLEFEQSQSIEDWYPKNKLIVNSRISAKIGMGVSDLFTKRTLACHSKLLALIEKYSSGNELELLKVAFTANLANCSKLVPPIKSRGELSQGAWMTGFYVGPNYIENNVLLYFENRFKKILKGKADFLQHLPEKKENTYLVLQSDAKKLKLDDNSIDYVFTDPPYGSAVPYFEQSIIWNSWLKFDPDYENEIVITDSKERSKKNEQFETEINLAYGEIWRVLKEGKFFSFTYHSLSGVEWRAITNACILNGFKLHNFEWLTQKSFTPRQINRDTTIKGDVLVTLTKESKPVHTQSLTAAETTDLFILRIKEWLKKGELDTNEIFLRAMKTIFSDSILIGNVNLLLVLKNNFILTDRGTWKYND
jgi:DNA modification methylase